MLVKQIWTANKYRNFNYLIVCPETGEAMAVDPLDHEKCLKAAEDNGWTITTILNTHEHFDHIGGNADLQKATGARIIAHENARSSIPDLDQGLKAGDVVRIGKSVELEALDTPGHTMAHVCLLSHTDTPALFCGDTLFNAGAGNCHNGGHPEELYDTFARQLSKLPDETLVYLARHKPQSIEDLRQARGLNAQRDGERILEQIRIGLELPDEECPRRTRRRRYDEEIVERKLSESMEHLRKLSGEAQIDAPFVAARAEIRNLVLDASDATPDTHRLLRGWRLDLVGADLHRIATRPDEPQANAPKRP